MRTKVSKRFFGEPVSNFCLKIHFYKIREYATSVIFQKLDLSISKTGLVNSVPAPTDNTAPTQNIFSSQYLFVLIEIITRQHRF